LAALPLTAGAPLRNPRRRAADLGFVYLRPRNPDIEPWTILLHERYARWGEGVTVLFGDQHVEFAADRTAFDELWIATMKSADPGG
jgi:hypothetical protein